MSILVEVCLESVYSAQIAEKAGASRIELCSALDLGGITPSVGLIKEVCNAVSIPVFVLIRPRRGDFCYNSSEIEVMIEDIAAAINAGAEGIVSGALNEQGGIDMIATTKLIKASQGLPFTFHRAFDRVVDPLKALADLIELGVDRVLTSGQAPNAGEGSALIKTLIENSKKRILIMPGGGLNSDNVHKIIVAGANEIHLSARAPVVGKGFKINAETNFNTGDFDEFIHYETSEDILKMLFEKLSVL